MGKHSKETVEVVRAALALAERDVDLGLASMEEIQAIPRTRFAPMERKQAAALLKEQGKSNRAIAKELGVAHTTVAADVGTPRRRRPSGGASAPDSGADAPEISVKKPLALPPPAKVSEVEEDLDTGHLKDGFMIRADTATRYAVYSGQIDNEVLRAAQRTAWAWRDLVQQLEGEE